MRFLKCFSFCHLVLVWAILAIPGTPFASEDPENASLRHEAAAQLEMAISAVQEAERQKALWIPAAEALEEAKAAFGRSEFELAIKMARDARQFAELGIRQLETPPYRQY